MVLKLTGISKHLTWADILDKKFEYIKNRIKKEGQFTFYKFPDKTNIAYCLILVFKRLCVSNILIRNNSFGQGFNHFI